MYETRIPQTNIIRSFDTFEAADQYARLTSGEYHRDMGVNAVLIPVHVYKDAAHGGTFVKSYGPEFFSSNS